MTTGMGKKAIAAGLLGGLLLGLFLTALTRQPPVPEDITSFLQSESLRLDRDLTYGVEDFQRFAARWSGPAPSLALYRNANGDLRYDRPLVQAVLASPFSVLGLRGPLVLNTLLLALAAFLAARVFGKDLGWVGILVVTVFIFSSAAFAQVFQLSPATLLLLSGAGAFGCIFGSDFLIRAPRLDEDATDREPVVVLEAVRWALAGAFLGVAAVHHPIYLLLAVAAFLAAIKDERALAWPAMAVGLVAVVLVVTFVQKDGGVWLGSAAIRGEVALAAPLAIDPAELGGISRAGLEGLRLRLDSRLLGWNMVYAFGGRHIGILVYFLPVLLAFVAGGGTLGRRYLLLLSVVGILVLVVLHPFDFAGAGLTNIRFLPFYGALWFVVTRYSAGGFAVGILAISAVSLGPLWMKPMGPQQLENGSYRHVSSLVRQYLPLETTQKGLFPGAGKIFGSLWVYQLSGAIPGASELMTIGDAPSEILIASPHDLGELRLTFPNLASDRIEVIGGEPGAVSYRPNGGVIFGVELAESAVEHPMWWSPASYYLYPLNLRLPGAAAEVQIFELEVMQ